MGTSAAALAVQRGFPSGDLFDNGDRAVYNPEWATKCTKAVNVMVIDEVSYVSDSDGKKIGVVVPIELWREIESERETAYLLKSPAMRKRLLEAKDRRDGISLEDVCEKLGL